VAVKTNASIVVQRAFTPGGEVALETDVKELPDSATGYVVQWLHFCAALDHLSAVPLLYVHALHEKPKAERRLANQRGDQNGGKDPIGDGGRQNQAKLLIR
jgi:hypothetical protein